MYGTVQTQVYTRKPRTLEYSNSHSYSKCESSKIARVCFARDKRQIAMSTLGFTRIASVARVNPRLARKGPIARYVE